MAVRKWQLTSRLIVRLDRRVCQLPAQAFATDPTDAVAIDEDDQCMPSRDGGHAGAAHLAAMTDLPDGGRPNAACALHGVQPGEIATVGRRRLSAATTGRPLGTAQP